MPGGHERLDQRGHVAGGADADGVAEAELAGAEVEEPLADDDHLLDRDRALPGVAEAHGDVGADVEPGVAGALHGRLEHRELLVEAAVEVLLREGLGGRAEDRDVLQPELEGPVEAALVGDQDRAVRPASPSRVISSAASASCGHPLRVHEGGRLDDRQPGGEQPAYELLLDVDGDERLLVLQAVARADLVDRDPLRQRVIVAASTTNTRRPSATCSPVAAPTVVTVPANGALRLSSIFIASSTPSTWPSSTASPSATRTSRTVPGIGAVSAPSPTAAAWSPKTSGRSKTNR